jgi:hypothetical protein
MATELEKRILDVVSAMPGILTADLIELVDWTPSRSVGPVISKLAHRGKLTRESIKQQGRRSTYAYRIGNGVPCPSERKQPKLDLPTPAAIDVQVAELRAKIAELEAWKASALERHPDLGVSPFILRARPIVAKLLRERGDEAWAKAAESGGRDNTVMVLATASALEEIQ